MIPLKDNISTRSFPVVTVALIVVNVVVYLFLQPKSGIDFSGNSLDARELGRYAAIPYELTHPSSAGDHLPAWLTVFTAMFSHAGLLHLGGNMLFLWIFGNNVEDSMGRMRFLAFYLLAGVAALALQVVVEPDSMVPTLGASGAIAGVLGGYLVLYPRARIITGILVVFFVTLVEIPAVYVLGFWFVQQAVFGLLEFTDPTGAGGGVASFAHVGGFLLGLALIRLVATYRAPEADAVRRRRA